LPVRENNQAESRSPPAWLSGIAPTKSPSVEVSAEACGDGCLAAVATEARAALPAELRHRGRATVGLLVARQDPLVVDPADAAAGAAGEDRPSLVRRRLARHRGLDRARRRDEGGVEPGSLLAVPVVAGITH